MTKQELESKANYIEDPILYPYRIKMDQWQYCLEKHLSSRKNGNLRWAPQGYHNTIDMCLIKMIDDAVKEENYSSLKEYTETLLEKIKTLNNFKLK